MPKGTIGGLHGDTGQVLSEGNTYNFNINIVDGGLKNCQEIEFELDETGDRIKVIYGTGWKLQYDNELPTELEIGQNYYIKKEQFHRLHKGNGELKLEIKEYD